MNLNYVMGLFVALDTQISEEMTVGKMVHKDKEFRVLLRRNKSGSYTLEFDSPEFAKSRVTDILTMGTKKQILWKLERLSQDKNFTFDEESLTAFFV